MTTRISAGFERTRSLANAEAVSEALRVCLGEMMHAPAAAPRGRQYERVAPSSRSGDGTSSTISAGMALTHPVVVSEAQAGHGGGGSDMTEKAQEKFSAGAVRITLPARVTYDPDALKESIGRLAELIGHPDCFSGADCLFQMERDFLFDPEGSANPGMAPTAGAEAAMTVGLSPRVKYDIGTVMLAVDKVIDLIGPHPCISGFDVLFKDQMIVINEELEAQRFG
jgi:hypothetical protein